MKTIRNKYNNSDSTERAKITKRETKTNSMGAALSSLGYHPKFPIGKEKGERKRGFFFLTSLCLFVHIFHSANSRGLLICFRSDFLEKVPQMGV